MSRIEASRKLRECAEHGRAGFFANLEAAFGVPRYWCHDHVARPDNPTVFLAMANEIDREVDELVATLGGEVNGDTSDGYHTFDELYHHRAVLFSVIVAHNRGMAWKSRKHHDGTMYDGMFIVGIDTPWGQASYHYDIDPYWDMFDCEEREAAPEWDGHTPDDAIERIGKLATLGRGECEWVLREKWPNRTGDEHVFGYETSCGARHTWWPDSLPSFCPTCGNKVKAVKR